ncbi:MAG TPA: quinone oxidoreductase [Actinocrinis sp.]|jgi:NADPH2:quinone reductase|uniref:quinone oxidoreductase family protein n=1 Tax=Actinocrinis sp. TaxID=1920516 RepID=UPI002DDD3DE7|nr:quinone oxidoreductase [Actinocrinis sp.]HEV3173295.1 quinone oxidoreductase [Actinocrinis sp.]
MLKAIVVSETGGPEALDYVDRPAPEPGPGQLLVEVAAAGVNFIEIYQRTGYYPQPLPFTPGTEFAGTVTALGEGVSGFAVGDHVATVGGAGSYAQFSLVEADRAVRVPAAIDLETAAAAILQGLTAHYLTTSTWPVQKDQTVLIHAAAGGMGLLLTQLVKARGARVIGTVSTPEKEAKARAVGADEIIRYTEVDDLAAEVRRLTDGRGVDVAYDGVGKTTFDASLASLRPRGMLVLFGASSGPVTEFDPRRLQAGGSLFLTRPTLVHYIATPEELAWRSRELFAAIEPGELAITVGGRYPLEEAGAAHTALESRGTVGKLLLIP